MVPHFEHASLLVEAVAGLGNQLRKLQPVRVCPPGSLPLRRSLRRPFLEAVWACLTTEHLALVRWKKCACACVCVCRVRVCACVRACVCVSVWVGASLSVAVGVMTEPVRVCRVSDMNFGSFKNRDGYTF